MRSLLPIMLLFTASYVHAEIYTWTDNKGTKHYTNSTYEIPERYRDKTKVLDLGIAEKKEASTPQQDATTQPAAPVQQGEQAQSPRPALPAGIQRPVDHPVREPQRKRIRRERSSAE